MKNVVLLLLGVLSVAFALTDTLVDSMEVTAFISDETELSSESSYRFIPITNSLDETSLSELISRQPGVQSRRYGGAGSFETVSIRGVDGRRVALFLDGVPQMSAMGGAVDLSRYAGMDIVGIEVYRGITPARFGGNSLGGAINIVTRKGGGNSGVVKALMGSFGEIKASSALTRSINEKLHLRTSLKYHRSDNDYPYLDRNNTPHNPYDDTIRNLENNQLSQFSFTGGTRVDFSEQNSLTLDWFHANKDIGIPAPEGNTNKTAEETSREDRINIAFLKKSKSGTRFQQGVYLFSLDDVITWSYLDKFGLPHGKLQNDELGVLKSTNRLVNSNSSLLISPLSFLLLDSRLDITAEQMLPSSDVDGFGTGDWECSRIRGNVAMDATFLIRDVSIITGGSFGMDYNQTAGGIDSYSDDTLQEGSDIKSDWSVRLGSNYLFASNTINVFANGSRYSRSPSLRELYGYHGGVQPNRDLKSETGVNLEGGMSYIGEKVRGECVLFGNYRENMIITRFDGVSSRAINLPEAFAYGVEQSLMWEIFPVLAIEENITFQHTESRGEKEYEGRQLPDEPTFTLQGGVLIGPIAGITLNTLTEFKTPFYREQGEQNRVPVDTTKNGSVSLSCVLSWNHKGFSAEAGLFNILNVRENEDGIDKLDSFASEGGYYSTLYPGRYWQIQIGYKF